MATTLWDEGYGGLRLVRYGIGGGETGLRLETRGGAFDAHLSRKDARALGLALLAATAPDDDERAEERARAFVAALRPVFRYMAALNAGEGS